MPNVPIIILLKKKVKKMSNLKNDLSLHLQKQLKTSNKKIKELEAENAEFKRIEKYLIDRGYTTNKMFSIGMWIKRLVEYAVEKDELEKENATYIEVIKNLNKKLSTKDDQNATLNKHNTDLFKKNALLEIEFSGIKSEITDYENRLELEINRNRDLRKKVNKIIKEHKITISQYGKCYLDDDGCKLLKIKDENTNIIRIAYMDLYDKFCREKRNRNV